MRRKSGNLLLLIASWDPLGGCLDPYSDRRVYVCRASLVSAGAARFVSVLRQHSSYHLLNKNPRSLCDLVEVALLALNFNAYWEAQSFQTQLEAITEN